MAKFRYIGADEVEVPALGRTVEPDQVVEVPDELVATPIYDDGGEVVGWDGLQWPESLWSEVGTAKKTAATPEGEE